MNHAAASASAWRSWLGNGLVLLALLVLGVAMSRWQSAPWWLAAPGELRWWASAASLLAYVGFSAWCLRRGARVRGASRVAGGTDVRIVFASQTGFAQLLAERSAESLRAAGVSIIVQAIDEVRADDLQQGRILFVVSTTGEGDPPDHALAFVRQAMARDLDLASLHYAVLALGDHEYQHFCQFGRQLDEWLRQRGAQPLFDRVDVDNADESALRHWQHHLGHLAGATELPDWDLPRYEAWTLAAREHLNAGSVGGPVLRIRLTATAEASAHWQAGDIAEVGPRHADTEVAAYLAALGWDGREQVQWQSQSQALGEVLSRAHLPAIESLRGQTAQAVVDTLTPLPHREYSIASLPQDGALELVIRQMHRADGRPGLGSGWLCAHAALGARIDLRIRSNGNFHLPQADVPVIYIGNGTGIAGLRAHLKARAAAGRHRNWLVFGERQRARDFLFEDEIAAWQREGVVARVDAVFSRDQAQRVYVQDALRAAADDLRAWVRDGAAIYVCGSLEGMAPGVDAVLLEVLGADGLDALRMAGRYRRDVY